MIAGAFASLGVGHAAAQGAVQTAPNPATNCSPGSTDANCTQAVSGATGAALPVTPTSEAASASVTEVVVTGSRVASPNLTSSSPITVVNSQEFRLEGATRVEDLINNLPQAFSGQGSSISNGATGTAEVDLRGLEAKRTLVLIDGKRLQPGDATDPVADLNFIPAALIDRVDVLTGGASAVYGSDAVGGVVNFIMRKDFQGVELNATGAFDQHSNQSKVVDGLNRTAGFPVPTGNVVDGGQEDITLLLGANDPDGRGNVTAYAEYRHQDPILQSSRDYSACTLKETATLAKCAGSETTNPAVLLSNDLYGASLPYAYQVGAGGSLSQNIKDFNYGPYNYYQRPDQRYTFGAFAHYQVDPKIDVYSSAMFMDDNTTAQIAPGGIFGNTVSIPCADPLLSAAQVATLCTAAGLTPAQSASIAVLRRNQEGGGRVSSIRHDDFRIVIGAKGDLNSAFSYDVSGQYGQTQLSTGNTNYFSTARIGNALNVVTNPATGQPTCASVLSGTDTACVPYNIFTPGAVTQAALNYLQVPGYQQGTTTEQDIQMNLTGSLGVYGVRSPLATDGVNVSLGAEYRREGLSIQNDLELQTGDLSGGAGPQPDTSGSFDVYELFGEIEIPIVQDKPFVKALSFNGGYRFSTYSTAGITNTYKMNGEYTPITGLTVRGGFNRAVRAPNVIELFTDQHESTGDFTNDPCAGATPTASLAQCEQSGVKANQYGRVPASTANQYNGLTGGNPDLAPEQADTVSGGIVVAPKTGPLHRFSFSADYFNIRVTGEIGGIGGQTILNDCLNSNQFCNLVHRDPNNGNLFLNTNDYVQDTNLNTGSVRTSGIDFTGDYRFVWADYNLPNFGPISFNYVGTYTSEFKYQSIPHAVPYDCDGLYGAVCGNPTPKYRHKFRATWQTPFYGISLSSQWRYNGAVSSDVTKSYVDNATSAFPFDSHISEQSYWDATVDWKITDHYRLTVGCNNVLDTLPPLVGSSTGGNNSFYNGNTYPGVYDAVGRYIFMNLVADF